MTSNPLGNKIRPKTVRGKPRVASNPVSVKNLTAIETSTIVKLRLYVPVGTKRTSE
jgi:hypothetical protein